MTREEAKALYAKAIDAGYSDEEAKAAITKRMTAPASAPAPEQPRVSTGPTQSSSYGWQPAPGTKMDRLQNVVQQEAQGGMVDRLRAGFDSSLLGTMQGARKLYNQAIGDDDTVDLINQQNQRAKDFKEQVDPAGSGFSAMDAGKILGDVGQFAAMPARGVLAGAATGAAQGLLQPTTADESQTDNALMGGAVGGVIPALGAAPRAVKNILTRTDSNTALEDFVRRQLGAQRGGDVSGLYKGVTDKVEAQHDALSKSFAYKYSKVEGSAKDLPPVPLASSSRLSDSALTLPEEVANALSPGAKRVAEALRRGATKTSPIVDKDGKQITEPAKVKFTEVRDTVRELRKAKRAMPYTDAGVMRGQQIDNIIDRLNDDLESWGGLGPTKTKATLNNARDVDTQYRDQMAPFKSRDAIVGQLRRGAGDEGAINRMFLGPDKGQSVEELLTRVPAARNDLRGLYGKNLLQERGSTTQIRQLDGGTTAENLLTPPERAYTTHLASAMREDKEGNHYLHIPHLLSSVLRQTPGVGKKLDNMINGVNRYGNKEVPLPPQLLQSLIRAYSVPQTSGEE